MNEKNFAKIGGATSLLDLFRESADSIGSNTNVATLGRVKTFSFDPDKGYGKGEIEPIPAWDKNDPVFEAWAFSEFVAGDLCLVVFTDNDFRPEIKNSAARGQETRNKNIHSRNFGIMIKL